MKPPAKNATREQLAETYLEEILVARAPVEHLLDKHLLVGVRELKTNAPGQTKFASILTCAMNSSAWESRVLITGLKPLMHTIA